MLDEVEEEIFAILEGPDNAVEHYDEYLEELSKGNLIEFDSENNRKIYLKALDKLYAE